MPNSYTKLKLISSLFLFLFILISSQFSYAQPSNTISKVETSVAREGEDLSIKVYFFESASVKNIIFAYKTFGESEYKKKEMSLLSRAAEYSIPGREVNLPYIQYYFLVETAIGSETYPADISVGGNPLQLQIVEPTKQDKEVLVLSPEKNSPMAIDEIFISISLLKASDEVDKKATKIFINERDITELCVIAEDLVLFAGSNFPEMFSAGRKYTLKVQLYNKSGAVYHAFLTSFDTKTSSMAGISGSPLEYRGIIRGESRNENISEVSRWYNVLDVDAGLNYKSWELSTKILVTSEEKGFEQPSNRYNVMLKGNFLEVNGGDAFPRFPSLILNGKRVRGVSGNLSLGAFNLTAAYGEISRGVDGSIVEILPPGSNPLFSDLVVLPDGKVARVNYGTFKRDVLSVRPALVLGNAFQFGLSFLHSKDDMSSIQFGTRPKENIVFGTDITSMIDDQRIQVALQGAFSVVNNDITTGDMSDKTIDEVFKPGGSFNSSPSDVRALRDIIGKFITFNQFLNPLDPNVLSPLSLNKLGTLAAEGSISFNYFDNFLKAGYVFRGNDFTSFGSSYIRQDVQGFNISDRIRLLANTVFVSVGYEKLNDNLQNTKAATTNFTTVNTSVSYMPRFNFPSITLAFSRFENDNGLKNNPVAARQAIQDETNRYSLQFSYNMHWVYETQLSLSGTFSERTDESVTKYNMKNTSAYLSTNTIWNDKLSTNFNGSLNRTTIDVADYNYIALSAGARYSMMRENLILNASVNPSFGDVQRTSFDFNAQYQVLLNLSVMFQLRYMRSLGLADYAYNDTVIGVSTRYSLK